MSRSIHKTAVIGPEVEMYGDVVIGPYTVVEGRTRLSSCTLGAHCHIGATPENRGTVNKGVVIYPGVTIGSHVTIQGGTKRATSIGEGSYICSDVHVAHDVVLDGDNTLYAGAHIGGGCILEPKANVGAGATIHQFVVLGPESMVGMNAAVNRHVPPCVTVAGTPAMVLGRNKKAKSSPMGWFRSWAGRVANVKERLPMELTEGDWRALVG